MRFRTLLLLSLVASALACASGSGSAGRPANIPRPDINAEIANYIFFGSGSTAPATVVVQVKNVGPVPITVRRIELDSPTMTEWGFDRQARDYREVVEPGATKEINFFATARTITSRRNEPLSFRTQVYFESGQPATKWREILNVISTIPPR